VYAAGSNDDRLADRHACLPFGNRRRQSARTRELWVSGQGRKADPAGCLRLRFQIDTKKERRKPLQTLGFLDTASDLTGQQWVRMRNLQKVAG
jgi:hypothetical protein